MNKTDLKKLREWLGLSVAQASAIVHVTARTWNRYESGERAVPEGVVELFCIKNNLNYKEITKVNLDNWLKSDAFERTIKVMSEVFDNMYTEIDEGWNEDK